MTNIITRSTVCFIKKETTENVPVAPTGATDAVELLNGFEMTPVLSQLESEALHGSIGKAKTIAGVEDPTSTLPGYLKGSGTEGTPPMWNYLAEALFGAESVAGTEYATTGASTVTSLAVTGAQANFIRGQGLLIKDATNGYRIRAVDSFPTANSISPSFQLPTGMAPATGTNLGKAVTWYPANTGHPSLTVWMYLGNGGAVEMISGFRPTDLSIDASAGALMKLDFSGAESQRFTGRAVVALVVERPLHHPRTERPRDFHRAVGAERVEDHHVIAPLHRLQAPGQVLLFVAGQNED